MARKGPLERPAKDVAAIVEKKTAGLVNQDQMMCLREEIRMGVVEEVVKIKAACEAAFKTRDEAHQRENASLKQRVEYLKLMVMELEMNRSPPQWPARPIQTTKSPNPTTTPIASGRQQAPLATPSNLNAIRQQAAPQAHQKKSFAQAAQRQTEDTPGEGWKEVIHARGKKQEAKQASLGPQEPAARRMLFLRSSKDAPRKAEEDITLAVNSALQISGAPPYIRVIRAGYSASGAISVLLGTKANAGMVLPVYQDSLIRAVKEIDEEVVGV